MRPVAACQRGQRLGEWRTDSDGRCTYHSDGKRTVTGESIVQDVLTHLSHKLSVIQSINEAYDAKFNARDGQAIRIHTPKH